MKRERERESRSSEKATNCTPDVAAAQEEKTLFLLLLSFFLSFFFESKNEETRDVSRIRIVNSVVDAYRIRQLQKANHQLTFAQREGRISRTRHNEGSCNEEHHPQGQVSCVFISCGMAWHSMERRRSQKKKKKLHAFLLKLPALSPSSRSLLPKEENKKKTQKD